MFGCLSTEGVRLTVCNSILISFRTKMNKLAILTPYEFSISIPFYFFWKTFDFNLPFNNCWWIRCWPLDLKSIGYSIQVNCPKLVHHKVAEHQTRGNNKIWYEYEWHCRNENFTLFFFRYGKEFTTIESISQHKHILGTQRQMKRWKKKLLKSKKKKQLKAKYQINYNNNIFK